MQGCGSGTWGHAGVWERDLGPGARGLAAALGPSAALRPLLPPPAGSWAGEGGALRPHSAFVGELQPKQKLYTPLEWVPRPRLCAVGATPWRG